MTVDALQAYLREHWPRIKEELLAGRYQPQTGAEGGNTQAGRRNAAIGHSDGAGPSHPAGAASGFAAALRSGLLRIQLRVSARPERASGGSPGARSMWPKGRRWVVDMDLEKFFDRVNHDILMARVARKVKDKRVLRLIRRYLQAGMMEEGWYRPGRKGRRKAGRSRRCCPTSCWMIWTRNWRKRGHAFCRYADDCNIYVRSRRAGRTGDGSHHPVPGRAG